MNERQEFLAKVAICSSPSSPELETVDKLITETAWKAGDEIYRTGDSGGSMFIVTEGVVELFGVVEGIEKLFMTVRPGAVFGLLSMIDLGDRPADARALEPTRAMVMEHAVLEELLQTSPSTGVKILRGIGASLGSRVRLLSQQYEAAVAWNLEITALAGLGLERLMTERVQVVVELVRGEPLQGTLLSYEAAGGGHQLFIETADRQVHLIPYHSIVRISVDRTSLKSADDSPTSG